MSDNCETKTSDDSFESNEFAKFMRKSTAMTNSPNSPKKFQTQARKDQVQNRHRTLSHRTEIKWGKLSPLGSPNENNNSHLRGPTRRSHNGSKPTIVWLIQNLETKLISRVSQHPTTKNMMQKLWVSIDKKIPNLMELPKDIETYNKEIQIQRLYQFLITIDDKYEPLKKEILRIKPLPSVEAAYAMIQREYAQLQALWPHNSKNNNTPSRIGAGLVTRDRGRPWQGNRNHVPRIGGGIDGDGSWSSRIEEDKRKLICSHCGRS